MKKRAKLFVRLVADFWTSSTTPLLDVRVVCFSATTPRGDVDGDVCGHSGKVAVARVQEAREFSRSGLLPMDLKVNELG